MSKVYSFRLDENNPREAQAREVIQAWVEEGYSLRHVVVEALISFQKDEFEMDKLYLLLDQIQKLPLLSDKSLPPNRTDLGLSNSFLDSVKQTARLGLSSE